MPVVLLGIFFFLPKSIHARTTSMSGRQRACPCVQSTRREGTAVHVYRAWLSGEASCHAKPGRGRRDPLTSSPTASHPHPHPHSITHAHQPHALFLSCPSSTPTPTVARLFTCGRCKFMVYGVAAKRVVEAGRHKCGQRGWGGGGGGGGILPIW